MPLLFVIFHFADLMFHQQPGYCLHWRHCCCFCSFICLSQRW